MAGRIFIAVLTLIVLFGFGTVISHGIHNLRTEEIKQTEIVDTDPGEFEKEVLLDWPLFRDSISEVESVTSSITEKPAPDASNYTPTPPTLTISGLEEDTSRTLTIVYNTELDDEMMGIIGPFLSFFIFGGIIGAILYSVWKGRR